MISEETITMIAEELGWTVEFEKECAAEFRQYSPAGEDFLFYVEASTMDGIVNEVDSYADDFDVEEHVKMWLDAKYNGISGVPEITDLVQDAKDIKQMLFDLAEALKDPDAFLNRKKTTVKFDAYLHIDGEVEMDGSVEDLKKAEENGDLLWRIHKKLDVNSKLSELGIEVLGMAIDKQSLTDGSIEIVEDKEN